MAEAVAMQEREVWCMWVVQGTWEGGWWVDARGFANRDDAVEYKLTLDRGTPQETHRVVRRRMVEAIDGD